MDKEKDHVCIVESDSSVRRSLKRLVSSFGMTVRSFATMEELFRAIPPSGKFCLIIDETEARKLLSRNGTFENFGSEVQTIVLADNNTQGVTQLAKEIQAVICLRRPVDDQALLDSIHWCLE